MKTHDRIRLPQASLGQVLRRRRAALGLAFAALAGFAGSVDSAWAQQAARQACAADYKALCAGVQPGEGRIIACFKQNENKLSSACKALMSKLR